MKLLSDSALKAISPALAAALLALIVVVGAIAVYIIVSYSVHKAQSASVELKKSGAMRVVGVLPLKLVVAPQGRSYLVSVLVQNLAEQSLRIDRVYIVDPNTHTALYTTEPLKPVTVPPKSIANVSFLIPETVFRSLESRLSLAELVLSSGGGGIEASMSFVPSKIASSAPRALRGIVGFKFVVINCSDAASWWVNVSQIVDIIEHVLTKYYYIKMVIINNTEQLYEFIENPSNFSGENWDGAIVINAHGEVVPIPSQFITGSSVDWRDWYSEIVKAIEGHGLVWVSVVGYPFFYVSNTKAGIERYTVGSQGIAYILNDSSANCFSSDEWRIMIGSRSYHDFLDNSVPLTLTRFGQDLDQLCRQIFGLSLPRTIHCARALFLSDTSRVLYSVYENDSSSIGIRELIAYDDFDADTLDPLAVDPQGDVYWWHRGSYSVEASTLVLYPGSAVIRADIGWADTIHAHPTNGVNEVLYLLNMSLPLPNPEQVYVLEIDVPNTVGTALPLTLVVVRNVAIPTSYIRGFQAFLNQSGTLVEVPIEWSCSSSGLCNLSILLRYLPPGGAKIVVVAGVKTRNMGLWSVSGNATIIGNTIELVPESPSSGGRAVLVYPIPPSDGRLVVSFDYEFVDNLDGRADGFVVAFFVNNETVPEIFSTLGGSLGFGFSIEGYAIEFDLYHNPFDPVGMHVALISGSVTNHIVYNNSSTVQTTVFSAGRWHRCRIVIDENTGVDVYVDGIRVLHYSGTLSRHGNILYLAATTGGLYDEVLVKNLTVYSNVVVVPSTSVHVLGLGYVSQSIASIDFLAKSLSGSYGYRIGIELSYGTIAVGGSTSRIGFVNLVYRYVKTLDSALDNESVVVVATSPIAVSLGSFNLVKVSVERNSIITVCIGSECTSYSLGSLDARPDLALYMVRGDELDVGWIKAYEMYPSFTGPRLCGAIIPLGRGYLVLNGWSPPDNVSKEYGYSYSGISSSFVAKMAIAVPVQLLASRS